MNTERAADPALPSPRGPLTAWLLDVLTADPRAAARPAPPVHDDPLRGDDLHLALYLCYELHYRALPGVDDAWEWDPRVLAFRAALERPFEDAVRALVAAMPDVPE